MNKKRYLIVIAIVVFAFLTVFTFANPFDKKEEKPNDNRVLEEIEEEDLNKKEETKEETKPVVVIPEYPIYNNHGVAQKPQIIVDDSYKLALEALEELEETLNANDVEKVEELVDKVKGEDKKSELEERLEVVKDTIELIDFVDTLVKDVKQASSKSEMDDIRSYIVESKLEERLENATNESVKELLIEKLESIASKLDDTLAPKINIEDGAILNVDTKITVTDDSEVTIKLNDKEVENNTTVTEEGKYTLVATDASFNTTTVSFIVDKQKPKFNIEDGLFSIEDVKVIITDLSFDYVEILNEKNSTKKVEKNNEFVLNESGKYILTAYDKVGNNEQISLVIEKEYNDVAVSLLIDDTTTKYATLAEALEVLKNENAKQATLTIYGNQDLNVVRSFSIGGTDTEEVKFVGGNTKAKITNVGDGHTNISATNPEAIITFEGLILADTTRYTESKNAPYTDWEFSYSDYAGNFNFIDVEFERAPMLDANGTHDVSYNLINCTVKQYEDEAKDLRYSVWVYSGATATIKNSTFTGARGIKIHKNYEKSSKAGKIVIDNNTFDTLTKKPGIAVGTITNLATTIEITNNTFIGNVPGDQGLYTYESDTVAPTVYTNNTLNGEAHTIDTSVFATWLNKQVQVTALIDGVATKYATLTEALTEINTKNIEDVKVTVYGSHELKPETLTLGGTNLKTLVFEKGNDTSKITVIGNGTTPTRTGNADAVVTFNGVSIDDTSVPYTTHWNFYYTEFEGNFNFNDVKFYHQVLTEDGGDYNFTNCIFENEDSSRYAIWLYGGNVNVTRCNFTGTRGLKLHSNYGTGESYCGQLGKVVIEGNTFNALTEKPGVVVGHVNTLDPNGETIIEITNNTFINTTKPGDQGNYVYESDTVGPNVWSNNTLNGEVYTLDTSVYS